MANKTLFKSAGTGVMTPKTDTTNKAGGRAYKFSDKHALAQYAATGCLNGTFYATAENQLQTVLKLAQKVEPEFVAKVALYSRTKGFMKDMPALLCAVLSVRAPELLKEVFPRVIDNGRMVRNFVQIIRSGVVGRKSLGSLPKRLVREWIEERDTERLFKDSVGNDPSLKDVILLSRPRPSTAERKALHGYLLGKEYNKRYLPKLVKQYEKYKQDRKGTVPDVPFQMLTALGLGKDEWSTIARNAPWQMTRMNLNTFQRHGVFNDSKLVNKIANRLRDPELVERARVFPYQLLAAYQNVSDSVPFEIREALQDAMEIAISNVPEISGQVYVFPDVSGSMHQPVTGHRRGSSSKVSCVDVSALVAAALMRVNKRTKVLPFENDVVRCNLNPRDSVMTNAQKLSRIGGGGTNCSAPLKKLNSEKANGDLIVYVSDNESWLDSNRSRHWNNPAATLQEWKIFKQRNKGARMICIDLVPNGTTQAKESNDIINVGGFSDEVFKLISAVAKGKASANHWVDEIEGV